MNDKIFFDTNILVYSNDSSEKVKQKIARDIIRKSLIKQNGVISVQVLSEFWVTVTRKLKEPLSFEVADKEIELFQLMEIITLDYPVFKDAIRFQRVMQISYWDSLILAASHSAGCKTIYTEDLNHGQVISNMELCNPFL
ncbi:MAG: PIN domain-containing protein [Spirochaetota bacterium]|nr:PIN domain-containing protein [Spirochaetota bacterium]